MDGGGRTNHEIKQKKPTNENEIIIYNNNSKIFTTLVMLGPGSDMSITPRPPSVAPGRRPSGDISFHQSKFNEKKKKKKKEKNLKKKKKCLSAPARKTGGRAARASPS
jgi:hypothetical protein